MFPSFLFLRPVRLNAVGLWSVRLEIWLVLHEPLEELVGGFGGEEGHGLSPFIGNRKRAT